MSSMRDITTFRVLKCESDRFIIDINGEEVLCFARSKMKKSDVMVGDLVKIEKSGDDYILCEVLERKNFLIRPNVANIDQLVIIVAPIPSIDYYLIDKLIINAHKQNLDIVLCLNKSDIDNNLIYELESQYKLSVNEILCVSAANNNLQPLKEALYGKLSCFAGQSAVGKSSITNSFLESKMQRIGDISIKNSRGKNTTTKAQIIVLDKSTYIVDTPGFSMLDIHDIKYFDLDLYYDEYVANAHKCKFNRCTHTAEPECNVRKLVETNILDKNRYFRYVQLYNELKLIKEY